jgi:hypothetical protein
MTGAVAHPTGSGQGTDVDVVKERRIAAPVAASTLLTTLTPDQPAMVVWQQGSVTRINLFARTSDGRFVERWWDGNQWSWSDHGFPPGGTMASAPTAVSWMSAGVTRINVFAQGGSGRLIERWWDGTQWNWSDHGFPPGTSINSSGAIIHWQQGGVTRLNLFMIGANGRLVERWWDGSQWNWSDHGQPGSVGLAQNQAPAIIAWQQGVTTRLNLFARQADGQLIERWWDGSQWNWSTHGFPPGTTIGSTPAMIAWLQAGVVRINVFAQGGNGRLVERWWDGNQWNWSDHGFAPGSTVNSAATIVAWQNGGITRINLFARGDGGRLIERWWDGNQWNWSDHGFSPATPLGPGALGSVTWQSGSVTRINVFGVGLDGRLVERWWDGNQWNWSDHGFSASTSPGQDPGVSAVQISVDRGCGGFYNNGDPIIITYTVNASATVTIYDFDPAGVLQTLSGGFRTPGTYTVNGRVRGQGVETLAIQATTAAGVVMASCSYAVGISTSLLSAVSVTVDRGCGGTYSAGERLTATYSVSVPVIRVRLYAIVPGGVIDMTPVPLASPSGSVTSSNVVGPTRGDRVVVAIAVTPSGVLSTACRYKVA